MQWRWWRRLNTQVTKAKNTLLHHEVLLYPAWACLAWVSQIMIVAVIQSITTSHIHLSVILAKIKIIALVCRKYWETHLALVTTKTKMFFCVAFQTRCFVPLRDWMKGSEVFRSRTAAPSTVHRSVAEELMKLDKTRAFNVTNCCQSIELYWWYKLVNTQLLKIYLF